MSENPYKAKTGWYCASSKVSGQFVHIGLLHPDYITNQSIEDIVSGGIYREIEHVIIQAVLFDKRRFTFKVSGLELESSDEPNVYRAYRTLTTLLVDPLDAEVGEYVYFSPSVISRQHQIGRIALRINPFDATGETWVFILDQIGWVRTQ